MIDQFQTLLLLGITLFLVFVVIRVVQSDLRQGMPSADEPAPDPGDRGNA